MLRNIDVTYYRSVSQDTLTYRRKHVKNVTGTLIEYITGGLAIPTGNLYYPTYPENQLDKKKGKAYKTLNACIFTK